MTPSKPRIDSAEIPVAVRASGESVSHPLSAVTRRISSTPGEIMRSKNARHPVRALALAQRHSSPRNASSESIGTRSFETERETYPRGIIYSSKPFYSSNYDKRAQISRVSIIPYLDTRLEEIGGRYPETTKERRFVLRRNFHGKESRTWSRGTENEITVLVAKRSFRWKATGSFETIEEQTILVARVRATRNCATAA